MKCTRIEKIENDNQLFEVRKLLHEELIKRQNWKITPRNPTGIKVSQNILMDNFDYISNWFVVYSENDLIACIRIHKPLNGKHELEYYGDIPAFLKEKRSYQISRLVIKEGYRSIPTLIPELIMTFTEFFYLNGADYLFTTSTFPLPGNLYLKFYMRQYEHKYEFPGSNEEVHLLVADRKDMERSIQYSIKLIEKYRKKNSRSKNWEEKHG